MALSILPIDISEEEKKQLLEMISRTYTENPDDLKSLVEGLTQDEEINIMEAIGNVILVDILTSQLKASDSYRAYMEDIAS